MSDDSFIHACAGGAGGVIAMCATYPLVGISTRAAIESTKKQDESIVKSALKIIQAEGVSGLYAGLNSSLIGIGVTNFVYYYFFERSRDIILTSKAGVSAAQSSSPTAKIVNGGALSTLESMLAGLVAGTATTIISNPIWVISTRQTVRSKALSSAKPSGVSNDAARGRNQVKKLSFYQTMSQIIRNDGVLALWRGLGPALVLVINPILQYTVFEQLKNWVVKTRLAKKGGKGSVSLSDWDFFFLGALSKLVATSVTYPQIVIKSRQQSASGNYKSANVLQVMVDIVKDEGPTGLYRGISSKLLQSVLTAAILFASKERVFIATKAALAPATLIASKPK
ncbi:mitochondrial carrier [Violaceomyces palustris]|uniref:Mitochondrial carrier n=1 Tax=Violaceomyces palustris TaxID=1673888 RepID=A0ACD0NRG0_9BASI|nr:mitochondrial carrier [Violaceomyces palustris]